MSYSYKIGDHTQAVRAHLSYPSLEVAFMLREGEILYVYEGGKHHLALDGVQNAKLVSVIDWTKLLQRFWNRRKDHIVERPYALDVLARYLRRYAKRLGEH